MNEQPEIEAAKDLAQAEMSKVNVTISLTTLNALLAEIARLQSIERVLTKPVESPPKASKQIQDLFDQLKEPVRPKSPFGYPETRVSFNPSDKWGEQE